MPFTQHLLLLLLFSSSMSYFLPRSSSSSSFSPSLGRQVKVSPPPPPSNFLFLPTNTGPLFVCLFVFLLVKSILEIAFRCLQRNPGNTTEPKRANLVGPVSLKTFNDPWAGRIAVNLLLASWLKATQEGPAAPQYGIEELDLTFGVTTEEFVTLVRGLELVEELTEAILDTAEFKVRCLPHTPHTWILWIMTS